MRKQVLRQLRKLQSQGFDFSHLQKKTSLVKKKNYDVFDAQLEKDFVAALSLYPELHDVFIRVRSRKQFFIMSAYVHLPSFFSRRRSYTIYVSRRLFPELISSFTADARVGVFAHELAHVQEYEELNVFELMWWSLRYVFLWSRRKIEYRTDLRACAAGATKFLREYVKIFFASKKISRRVKHHRHRGYVRPAEFDWLLAQKKL